MVEAGTAGAVCDVPVLHPLLEDATHHLGSTISCDLFRDFPRGTEVSHARDLVLAVKLARGWVDSIAFHPVNLSAITRKLWPWSEK